MTPVKGGAGGTAGGQLPTVSQCEARVLYTHTHTHVHHLRLVL